MPNTSDRASRRRSPRHARAYRDLLLPHHTIASGCMWDIANLFVDSVEDTAILRCIQAKLREQLSPSQRLVLRCLERKDSKKYIRGLTGLGRRQLDVVLRRIDAIARRVLGEQGVAVP